MPAPLSTLLTFDVEDLIAPEADDAPLWMAQMLSEHGLTGSFMIVGEKARLLERRGRRDVIEALKRHHIGYHSTWHSVHPTTTEHCLERDFAQGIDALWAWDRDGWQDTERIFGRALLGWARTGKSWAPSIQGLMGRLGRAYIYSPIRLPQTNVCWYGGCLGFHDDGVGGFDASLFDDAQFAERLAQSEQGIAERTGRPRHGAYWLNFFVGHPTRAIHTAFWDAGNFSAGANPPRSAWKPATLHPAEKMPTIKANFRRLCVWLTKHKDLEIVGWNDLITRYDGQRPQATHDELLDAARLIAAARVPRFTDFFTAAELLVMFSRALLAPSERYVRPSVLGPLSTPPRSQERQLSATDLRAAVPTLLEHVERTGHLPSSVVIAGQPIGIGSACVALAQVLLGASSVTNPAEAYYPIEAEVLAQDAAKQMTTWIIHPKNMDLTIIMEQTRLQCWTLKPAWPRSALGL